MQEWKSRADMREAMFISGGREGVNKGARDRGKEVMGGGYTGG